ncbi:hypothetical protein OROHE_001431 [Orobanche hederae]
MVAKKITKSQLGMYFWFFCVVTVLCLAGVVVWLSLNPKNPNIRISNLHFPPARDSKNQSSHRNASVSVQNESIIIDLEIFNPNKRMGIYYSVISLELYRSGGVVGTNSIPAFYQGYKNTMMLRIPIHAGREFWQGVNGMDFTVRVETDVKFRIIKWKTKLHRIVYEEQFRKVKINTNGTVSGGKLFRAEKCIKSANQKLRC